MVEKLPRTLLHAEGLFLFGASLALYLHADYSVLAFVLLLLVPDLAIIAFAAGPRVGAAVYDVVHTTVWPLTLGVIGVLGGHDVPVQVALIWLAHIGMDRAVGYGLKYPTGFNDSHLQRV